MVQLEHGDKYCPICGGVLVSANAQQGVKTVLAPQTQTTFPYKTVIIAAVAVVIFLAGVGWGIMQWVSSSSVADTPPISADQPTSTSLPTDDSSLLDDTNTPTDTSSDTPDFQDIAATSTAQIQELTSVAQTGEAISQSERAAQETEQASNSTAQAINATVTAMVIEQTALAATQIAQQNAEALRGTEQAMAQTKTAMDSTQAVIAERETQTALAKQSPPMHVSQSLPTGFTGSWQGVFYDVHRDIPMTIYIQEVAGQTFAGKINYPDSGNTTTIMQGSVVTDLSSEVQKWEHVQGFNSGASGTWIKFTEPAMEPGGNPATLLNGWYYARVTNDGAMYGSFFVSQSKNQPRGNFTVNRTSTTTSSPPTSFDDEIPAHKWSGVFHDVHRDIPMYLTFTDISGQYYSGEINYPDSGNTTTILEGSIVTDLSSESNRWQHVPGYGSTESSLWLKFTETAMKPGGNPATLLNGWYYACITNEKNMKGVFFIDRHSTSPRGTFELHLSN
jgi:hypothetical protein